MDTVNDLDNVLYEVSNEAGSPYSDSWQARVIKLRQAIRSLQAQAAPRGDDVPMEGWI